MTYWLCECSRKCTLANPWHLQVQARLAIAVAAAQEGEEKAGGALQEAKGQSEAALGRAIALEAECAQLQRQAADLAASLKASQADGAAREAELESESERRSALDLELARTQEALDESKMLHQALQQQHTASQVHPQCCCEEKCGRFPPLPLHKHSACTLVCMCEWRCCIQPASSSTMSPGQT